MRAQVAKTKKKDKECTNSIRCICTVVYAFKDAASDAQIVYKTCAE